MAFQTATGYGNLPNGNFSPVIYSKQVQLAFRKSTVVGDITNSDYFGEIANQGDTVRIIKEPEISVKAYARGTNVTAQDLDISADSGSNIAIDLDSEVLEIAGGEASDDFVDVKVKEYDVKEIGWNYYMNEFSAAIGIEQIKKLKIFE